MRGLNESRLRVLLVAWVVFISLSVPPAGADAKDPIDAALDACLETDQGLTTAGMVGCTSTAIDAWDSRLNEVYQKAMAALDPRSRDLLRAAQRQWLAFRTAEQSAQSGPWQSDRGSIVRVSVLGANLSAIKERVEELRLYLP